MQAQTAESTVAEAEDPGSWERAQPGADPAVGLQRNARAVARRIRLAEDSLSRSLSNSRSRSLSIYLFLSFPPPPSPAALVSILRLLEANNKQLILPASISCESEGPGNAERRDCQLLLWADCRTL